MSIECHNTIPWRSLLFVPANKARFVAKARISDADAIIIDLEDAILPGQKADARAQVPGMVADLSSAGRNVLVRINRPLPLAIRDIEASVSAQVSALVVAKASSAEHLALIGEAVAESEARLGLPEGHTRLVPLIETAGGVARMEEIASSPRVVAMACGDEDLAADLLCEPDSETIVAIKHRLVLAAALKNVWPLGLLGSITEFRDTEAYGASVRRSREAGLRGTLCIHPAQVAIANHGFAPSSSLIEQAARVVEAAEAAQRAGSGTVGLDGRMIDAPVLRRACQILAAARSYGASPAGNRNPAPGDRSRR